LQDGGDCARSRGNGERQARVRVICATNSDLEAAVETRTFRQDLFYRIDVIGLHLSPLRERKEDIPQLCEYFMHKLARKFGKSAPQLAPDALHLLKQWNWPGNLRELENWLARAIALGGEEDLGAELSRQIALAKNEDNQQYESSWLKDATGWPVFEASQAAILRALQTNHWNSRITAEEINMSYHLWLHRLRNACVPSRRRNRRGSPPVQ
jgi:transcriptional regulator with PAS, ATPase and Fis domain